MSDIRIIHFRCWEDNKVLTTGGVTVAVRAAEAGKEAAVAICSAGDGFNPNKGRKRALARLNSKPKHGRENSQLVHEDDLPDPIGLERPAWYLEMPGVLSAGYDFMDSLKAADKFDLVAAFAWDVAARAVMLMKGGTPENIQRLWRTLKAFPRKKKSA